MTDILFLFIGAAAGFAAAWFIGKSYWRKGYSAPDHAVDQMREDYQQIQSQLVVEKEKNDFVGKELEERKKLIATKDEELLHLSKSLSSREAELKALQEKLQSQQKDLEQLQEKFRLEFKNLANEILEEKTGKFTKQNKDNLDTILKPLQEKIREFEKKVEEAYHNESKERFSLKEEVKRLAELNQQVSQETNNLTRALKGESKTQGNWGELILESILEKSGLVKDREYFVQASYKDDEGNRLQPDVVISYPGNRHVIIDSKVSLTAYERYVNAPTDEERERALKEHLQSVRNHIKNLSDKNYQDLYDLPSLDFVMLFMAVEPSYMIAIQHDPELWNYAYDKRILLISPTHLIAALKMIVSLWRQEYQSRNVEEIARQSGALYDKFAGLLEDLQEIGSRLESTRKSYDKAMNKISTGKGNLLRRVEQIKQMGAETKKNIPSEYFDTDLELPEK